MYIKILFENYRFIHHVSNRISRFRQKTNIGARRALIKASQYKKGKPYIRCLIYIRTGLSKV